MGHQQNIILRRRHLEKTYLARAARTPSHYPTRRICFTRSTVRKQGLQPASVAVWLIDVLGPSGDEIAITQSLPSRQTLLN